MVKPMTKSGEFTYADYLRWPETERWQLLDGRAHAMAPPSLNHQRVVTGCSTGTPMRWHHQL